LNKTTYVQTLVEFLLLLVDYAQAKVDLVRLLEVGFHAHDLGEGLFGMFQGAIAVVQNADPIPQLRFLHKCQSLAHALNLANMAYLGIRQMIQCLLVGRVSLLQVVHHEITVSYTPIRYGLRSFVTSAAYQGYPRPRHWPGRPLRWYADIPQLAGSGLWCARCMRCLA
jgi:hypothetical protein